MAESKNNRISLKKNMAVDDGEFPRGMAHLANEINGSNKETENQDKPRDEEIYSFKKGEGSEVNNSEIIERMIFFKRRKNKKTQTVYLYEDIKEKLDILSQSAKYKDFDRVEILSAVISKFLEDEKDEIKKTMREMLEKWQNKINNLSD